MKTKRILPGAVIALAALTIAAGPAPEAWNVDASHTGINFSVKHFFTPVQGQFDDYEVNLVYDRENPANSSVSVRIAVSSIETHNDRRNAHLLSGDFFEAERSEWAALHDTLTNLSNRAAVWRRLEQLEGAVGIADRVLEADLLDQPPLAPARPAAVAVGADDVHADLARRVPAQARAILHEQRPSAVARRREGRADPRHAAARHEEGRGEQSGIAGA